MFRLDKYLDCEKHGKVRHTPVGDIYVCQSCIRERPKVALDDTTDKDKKVNEVKKVKKEVKQEVNIFGDIPASEENKEVKPFTYGQRYKPLDAQYWREKFRKKFQKKITYLIFMFLRNGKFSQFLVSTRSPSFEYMGGHYHINPDMGKYDIHSRYMMLVYHQDVAEPFDIKFNLEDLRRVLDKIPDDIVKKALNPYSLIEFINSQVIEKVLKGGELEKDMRTIKLLIIVNLIITVIVGIVVAKGMGYI
jgi:hypothetical protein